MSTHARAHTRAEVTRTPLSCGGDECDADSLSVLIQSYIPTCVLVCLCVRHICSFFVCFSEYVLQLVGCLTLCFSSVHGSLFEQQPYRTKISWRVIINKKKLVTSSLKGLTGLAKERLVFPSIGNQSYSC